MRFLLDNNLSVELTAVLESLGHDAAHVRTLGLGSASDPEVLATAATQSRVLVSGDRDFGRLLAELRSDQPSVV